MPRRAMSKGNERRPRRTFTKEHKAQVVALVRESGRSVGAVASELGLTVSTVRQWLNQAVVDEGRQWAIQGSAHDHGTVAPGGAGSKIVVTGQGRPTRESSTPLHSRAQ